MRTEPIVFKGVNLVISEASAPGPSHAPPSLSAVREGGMFVPRSAASRPRAGLGRTRKPGVGTVTGASASTGNNYPAGLTEKGRSQDDFRKMLG